MKEIILSRDTRLALRAKAHHLDPFVLLGANGLTQAVMNEIDRALKAHELIKVRVPTDDREELESIFAEVAETLGAARVQLIGKLLVLWRPSDQDEDADTEAASRLAALTMGRISLAGQKQEPQAPAKRQPKTATKKVASKKPGEKKKRVETAPRRARPKRTRVTKKAAMAK